MTIHPEYLKVPVVLGEQTCMGVPLDRPPPYPWGNRVDLLVDNVGPLHVLNMTAEHLKAASDGWGDDIWSHAGILNDGKVWISVWDKNWCLINDGRIPKSWYEEKLNWRGKPSVEIAQAIYNAVGGDPYNEIEQFTDPKSYWEKRGWTYSEQEGSDFALLSKTVTAEARRLNSTWQCDGIVDLTIVNPGLTPGNE